MKEVLIYDDNFKDRGFDVCTPQECADLFNKPVKSKGIIYQPFEEIVDTFDEMEER